MSEEEKKVEDITGQETQTKAPTQEEIDALIAKAQEEAKAEAQKEYQGIQRTVSAKDREIKKLKEQLTRPSPSGKTRTDEIMLEEMKSRAAEEGVANPRIAALEAELQRARQMETIETYTKEWRDKMTAKITEAGHDPEDERFDDVWESFATRYAVDGKFELTDKKLDRVLNKAKQETKPPEEKKETKEDEWEKRLEEEKRKWMEEHGLLATETGGPSGAASKWEEVRDKYIEDPTNPQVRAEYMRLRRERGL